MKVRAICLCGWRSKKFTARSEAAAAGVERAYELGGRVEVVANGYVTQPHLPPAECQPWRVHQDGHPDLYGYEGQWCGSELRRVDLRLEPGIAESRYSHQLQCWVDGPDYWLVMHSGPRR